VDLVWKFGKREPLLLSIEKRRLRVMILQRSMFLQDLAERDEGTRMRLSFDIQQLIQLVMILLRGSESKRTCGVEI
jgi:hypothetical protein